jgi:branched-chain amino acid transport system substrate-binding protein
MRADLVLRALALTLTVAAGGVVTGCGNAKPVFKIGVVADCTGINRSLHDAELSGAELPLITRGAHLKGRLAGDGITSVDVAGRSVKLVPGCTEVYEFSVLTAELRRLVEREHVDAVIAAGSGADEIVMRDLAHKYPGVVFLPVVHGPREVTLQRQAPNVFRVVGDHGQGVAGLATYAYRRLGWRRAAVVLANWDTGWGDRDAFVAEFCSLGGRVTSQLSLDVFDPAGKDVARVPRDVDGVAVFSPQFNQPAGFLRRLAERYENPARRIVVGPSVTDDPVLLRAAGGALGGVTGTSYNDAAEMSAYLHAYARAFPGAPAGVSRSDLVTGYRDAVESLLQGLESADGNSKRLRAGLAGLRTDLLSGPVRLDADRQAVVSTSLVRIKRPVAGQAQPALAHLGTIRGVDQSVGGLLAPTQTPSDRPARCRRGQKPPPWSG